MEQVIDFSASSLPLRAFRPSLEIGGYEALWQRSEMTFKRVADLFRSSPGQTPAEIMGDERSEETYEEVKQFLPRESLFGIRIHGDPLYPARLRDAIHPVELLYFTGDWGLTSSRSVAVVGTRNPSEMGLLRTRRLVRELVQHGFTIMSGLAAGIDTAAHRAAMEFGGNTIAVLGTPLSESYPKENAELQQTIAQKHLLISQVPFLRYNSQDYRLNRGFFPERNKTMSALSVGTVIVEASNTSGTLIQARAALAQNRKLFILESCFQDNSLTWPDRFEKKGAVRVRSIEDILSNLDDAQAHQD
jgi:DNA processing protein